MLECSSQGQQRSNTRLQMTAWSDARQREPHQPLLPASSKSRRTSFGQGVEAEGRDNNGDDLARDEEILRRGLERNVLHLSNLARANHEELTRLREQVRSKDADTKLLQETAAKVAEQHFDRDGSSQSGAKATTNATNGARRLFPCGNMVTMANRMAAGTRHALKPREQPTTADLMEESAATAAMGARMTEDQLLRSNREMRGQLERALQEADAHRLDKQGASARADLIEKEKAKLEARLASVEDEVKLQVAPLKALQLELTQARLDTETARKRLMDDRRDSRIRQEETEKANSEAQQRAEQLEFDVGELTKAWQREATKASKYEGMYIEVSEARRHLAEEVEQRKVDAKRIALELTRLQTDSRLSPDASRDGEGGGVEDAAEKERNDAEVEALKAQVKLQQQKLASSENTMAREVENHRGTAERLSDAMARLIQGQARHAEEKENLLRLHREKEETQAGALQAAKQRANSLGEEAIRVRLDLVEQQEHGQEQQNGNEIEFEERLERMTARQHQLQSVPARLSRTVDELCDAEAAAELALTCLHCTRLAQDPHIMAPCGHTLCAECCRGTRKGGEGQGAAVNTGESATRTRPVCVLCEKGGVAGSEIECWAAVPNRAVAALVSKHIFCLQRLEVVRAISAELWTNGLTA